MQIKEQTQLEPKKYVRLLKHFTNAANPEYQDIKFIIFQMGEKGNKGITNAFTALASAIKAEIAKGNDDTRAATERSIGKLAREVKEAWTDGHETAPLDNSEEWEAGDRNAKNAYRHLMMHAARRFNLEK